MIQERMEQISATNAPIGTIQRTYQNNNKNTGLTHRHAHHHTLASTLWEERALCHRRRRHRAPSCWQVCRRAGSYPPLGGTACLSMRALRGASGLSHSGRCSTLSSSTFATNQNATFTEVLVSKKTSHPTLEQRPLSIDCAWIKPCVCWCIGKRRNVLRMVCNEKTNSCKRHPLPSIFKKQEQNKKLQKICEEISKQTNKQKANRKLVLKRRIHRETHTQTQPNTTQNQLVDGSMSY